MIDRSHKLALFMHLDGAGDLTDSTDSREVEQQLLPHRQIVASRWLVAGDELRHGILEL